MARAVGVGHGVQVEETRQAEFALLGASAPRPTSVIEVDDALRQAPGVERVQVSYGAGRATLEQAA